MYTLYIHVEEGKGRVQEAVDISISTSSAHNVTEAIVLSWSNHHQYISSFGFLVLPSDLYKIAFPQFSANHTEEVPDYSMYLYICREVTHSHYTDTQSHCTTVRHTVTHKAWLDDIEEVSSPDTHLMPMIDEYLNKKTLQLDRLPSFFWYVPLSLLTFHCQPQLIRWYLFKLRKDV